MRSLANTFALALALLFCGCGGDDATAPPQTGGPSATPAPLPTATPTPLPPTTAVTQRLVASFDTPWAMTFVPDGRLLVTERGGNLFLVSAAGTKTQVAGVPAVVASGQLGLHDIVLDPRFPD